MTEVYRVKTAGGYEFDAVLEDLYDHSETVTWAELIEGTAPPCWTDGKMWGTNEADEPSDPVVSFKRANTDG